MNADVYIMGKLAEFAMQQGARHGGIAPMCSIAHVVRNRVEAGWHGGDWLRVLDAAPDAEGNDYRSDPWRVDLNSLVTRRLLERIDMIYEGSEEDVYSGSNPVAGFGGGPRALYFGDLSCPTLRPWFVENIVRNPDAHPRLGNVGPVTLFG